MADPIPRLLTELRRLQKQRADERRQRQLRERVFLQTLNWSDDQVAVYQRRIVGIEHRFNRYMARRA